MKAGAADYLIKDNLKRLGPAVDRELREAEVRREGRRAENRQRLLVKVLERLNQSTEKTYLILDLLLLVREFTGFETLAIRLKEGEDYPYYEAKGFPTDFVETERYLCARDLAGHLIRDSEGNPYLECM